MEGRRSGLEERRRLKLTATRRTTLSSSSNPTQISRQYTSSFSSSRRRACSGSRPTLIRGHRQLSPGRPARRRPRRQPAGASACSQASWRPLLRQHYRRKASLPVSPSSRPLCSSRAGRVQGEARDRQSSSSASSARRIRCVGAMPQRIQAPAMTLASLLTQAHERLFRAEPIDAGPPDAARRRARGRLVWHGLGRPASGAGDRQAQHLPIWHAVRGHLPGSHPQGQGAVRPPSAAGLQPQTGPALIDACPFFPPGTPPTAFST